MQLGNFGSSYFAKLRAIAARRVAHDAERFCILAFGKLEGGERTYSSDSNLFGVYSGGDTSGREAGARLCVTGATETPALAAVQALL